MLQRAKALLSILLAPLALSLPIEEPDGRTFPLRTIPMNPEILNHHRLFGDVMGPERKASGLMDLSLMSLFQLVLDVKVGTPPQSVPLVVDNTMVNSWVPSIDCVSAGCTYLYMNAFNQSASSSLVHTGNLRSQRNGDYVVTQSNMTGEDCQDVFLIGGTSYNGKFVLVNGTSNPNATMLQYYGKLGFGFPYPSSDPTRPSLIPPLLGSEATKLVTFNLRTFNHYGVVGNLQLGAYNPSVVNMSTYRTYPVYQPEKGWWAVQLSNIIVSGLSFGYNGLLVIDMASPFHMIPKSLYATVASFSRVSTYGTLVSYAPNNGVYYKVPCNAASNLRPITLQIYGDNYVITPDQYLIGDGTNCVWTFFGQDLSGPLSPVGTVWMLGNTFFQNRTVQFNYDANTISIASLLP